MCKHKSSCYGSEHFRTTLFPCGDSMSEGNYPDVMAYHGVYVYPMYPVYVNAVLSNMCSIVWEIAIPCVSLNLFGQDYLRLLQTA